MSGVGENDGNGGNDKNGENNGNWKEIADIIGKAASERRSVFDLEESRTIMELAGVPFNGCGLARSPEEAVELAASIGYPVVMKIVSPQVIHKTEVGGVRVGISSGREVRRTFCEIVDGVRKKVDDAEIQGILIEEMVSGTELIVGTTTDPQFGHMLMFGIGGIFVEVYRDVSFRLIPINRGDAADMMSEIRGKQILDGMRGLPGADREEVTGILLAISGLVERNPLIKELDINPLLIAKRGVVAVDARILLDEDKF